MPAKPVMMFNWCSSFLKTSWYPSAWFKGTKGWIFPHWGLLKGSISEAAFNFIEQEPREIMEWFNAKSLRSNFLIYRIISVSDWYLLKISFSKNKVFLSMFLGITVVVVRTNFSDFKLKASSKQWTIASISLFPTVSFMEIETCWLST